MDAISRKLNTSLTGGGQSDPSGNNLPSPSVTNSPAQPVDFNAMDPDDVPGFDDDARPNGNGAGNYPVSPSVTNLGGVKQQPQAPASPAGSSLMFVEDFINEPDQPLDWVVDELLVKGGLSFISAGPKVGKSTLAMSLLLSVSYGSPFLGRDTSQGAALYLSLDQARRTTLNRFRNVVRNKKNPPRVGVKTSFEEEGSSKGRMEWLGNAIREHDFRLVVVDTIAAFRSDVLGDGINGGYGAGLKVLQDFRVLSEATGCHICFLHHTRKGGGENGEAMLGSTVLLGCVDALIELDKEVKDTTEMHFVRAEQLRDGTRIFRSRYEISNNGVATISTFRDPKRDATRAEIKRFLQSNPGSTTASIKAAIPKSPNLVHAELATMTQDGIVCSWRDLHSAGRPIHYTLV